MLSADEIVSRLGLKPHPEGGHYREIFRDVPDSDGRALSTSIVFLLKNGERSHWHRIDATEIWHFHAGAALTLETFDGQIRSTISLGPDILNGESPQGVIPKGTWQAAATTGAWTLVGCTVTPGFDFGSFELAPPDFDPHPAQ